MRQGVEQFETCRKLTQESFLGLSAPGKEQSALEVIQG